MKSTVDRNSWCFFSDIYESKDGGRYQTLSVFPKILSQPDDIPYITRYGDRCEALSLRFYGEQRLWWVILVANNLNDPLVDFVPGTELIIPSVRYVRDKIIR